MLPHNWPKGLPVCILRNLGFSNRWSCGVIQLCKYVTKPSKRKYCLSLRVFPYFREYVCLCLDYVFFLTDEGNPKIKDGTTLKGEIPHLCIPMQDIPGAGVGGHSQCTSTLRQCKVFMGPGQKPKCLLGLPNPPAEIKSNTSSLTAH